MVLFWAAIGSQAPDFVSVGLKKLNMDPLLVRKLTHEYTYPIILWLLVPDNDPFGAFGIAVGTHYFIDLFSGLEPLYIFGLVFGERTAIQYVTEEHRRTIGTSIEKWGEQYLVADTEDPTPELAWFWIMQFAGSIFCCFGILFYVLFKM